MNHTLVHKRCGGLMQPIPEKPGFYSCTRCTDVLTAKAGQKVKAGDKV